ncbi:hypothetical protein JRQ81_001258 [Phrynocephalus forsythii]|uniref:Uncharacterized protein n=1 Tax=Phrynocephalus forsythii TaxID=171643 RepID=A0A9Q0Y7N2_9SAUR|nr:hypothetical protein JRQ81_001258 [Phrynocephalus forsythii]
MQIYSRCVLLKLLPMLDSLLDNLRDKALSYHEEVLSLIDYATEAARHAVDAASKQLATAVFLRRHAWLRTATITDDARNCIEDSPFDGEGLFASSTDESLDTILKMRLRRSPTLTMGLPHIAPFGPTSSPGDAATLPSSNVQPRHDTRTPPRLHLTSAQATSLANDSASQPSALTANRRPDYIAPTLLPPDNRLRPFL